MSNFCVNCSLMKARINQFTSSYEQLLAAKQYQVVCSHKIIKQLETELSKQKSKLKDLGVSAQYQQKCYTKIMNQQNQTLEYYRKRQLQLVDKMKKIENELFVAQKQKQDKIEESLQLTSKTQLSHHGTSPIKGSLPTTDRKQYKNKLYQKSPIQAPSHKGQNNKQNTSFERLLHQSSFNNRNQYNFQQIINVAVRNQQNSNDSIKLKVCQDHLNVMDVKYKVALLKAVQINTFK